MGGKSSSSSTTASNQYDNRIGATDNAVVVAGGSTLNLTDPGLVEFAKESLNVNEQVLLKALENASRLSISSLESIGSNADKAFEFVDKQRQDDESRTTRELLPWVIGGASVLAIAWAIRGQ